MTKDNWLPPGYEVPKPSGNYMKLDEDTNKFRIMSQPIIGYAYWTEDNKPVRLREKPDTTPDDIRMKDGKPERIKHFWAFVVWHYMKSKKGEDESKLQLLEITQASVQNAISDLVTSEDWGDPKEYDITVTGKGEGLDRKYTVQPSPHKAVPADAHKAYRETRINLEALFDGGDPFSTNAGSEVSEDHRVTKADTPF
jgi:hypothetical protein